MQLFYCSEINTSKTSTLNPTLTKHVTSVLRKKKGDVVYLTDGKGQIYEANIIEIEKKKCIVQTSIYRTFSKSKSSLHIAIAPTKNNNRLEWFLEKVVEIGVDEISFIHCANSERKKINYDRLKKIVIAAMQQSLKAFMPTLHELSSFEAFIQRINGAPFYLATCQNQLPLLQEKITFAQDTIIAIGPEGDFSLSEKALSKSKNGTLVSLGKQRLRVETAGIVACHTFWIKNQISLKDT